MHIYETPEINTLKLAFAQNTAVLSDPDNRGGDETEEDDFGGFGN